jgi:hypothetical protein
MHRTNTNFNEVDAIDMHSFTQAKQATFRIDVESSFETATVKKSKY